MPKKSHRPRAACSLCHRIVAYSDSGLHPHYIPGTFSRCPGGHGEPLLLSVTGLLLSLVACALLLLTSCFTLPKPIADIISRSPQAPSTSSVTSVSSVVDSPSPDPSPSVTSVASVVASPSRLVGPEESISPLPGDRPSVTVAPDGSVFVIWDKGTGDTLWCSRRQPDGAWLPDIYAKADSRGPYDASRIFLPHAEYDINGDLWISAKFGVKEGGSAGGQAIWPPYGTFLLAHLKGSGAAAVRGNGEIHALRDRTAVLIGSDGRWIVYSQNGSVLNAGQLKIGATGEKLRAAVRGNVWHIAMHGYSKENAMYRSSAYLKPVVWCDSQVYRDQWPDVSHPSICADLLDPHVAYIGAAYKAGIYANIIVSNKPIFAATNLLLVCKGGSVGVDRFGPQWAPASGGGAWIAYVAGKRIKIRKLYPAGAMDPPLDICPGRVPTLCADPRDSSLHLVYDNNGIKYRRLHP